MNRSGNSHACLTGWFALFFPRHGEMRAVDKARQIERFIFIEGLIVPLTGDLLALQQAGRVRAQTE